MSAIGGVQGLGNLASLGGISGLGNLAGTGQLSNAAALDLLAGLIKKLDGTTIDPSVKVAISAAANSLLQGDTSTRDASMSELAQVLALALILQLLQGQPGQG